MTQAAFVSIEKRPSRCLCVKPAFIWPALGHELREFDAFEFMPYRPKTHNEPADATFEMPVLAISWPKLNCLRFESLN